MEEETSLLNAVELATELTIAWLGNSNTRVSSDEVAAFLNSMHEAVVKLGSGSSNDAGARESQTEYTPATTARRSLASKDHIISLIDGKPYKTLRRHLSRHGLTPEQYRERYGLKPDYPMVAPSYSEVRRSMAQKIGLGRKGRSAEKATSSDPKSDAPARHRRKPRAKAE